MLGSNLLDLKDVVKRHMDMIVDLGQGELIASTQPSGPSVCEFAHGSRFALQRCNGAMAHADLSGRSQSSV